MAETIRAGLTDAGIHTLAWDHPPSEPTQPWTPDAQVLIDRLTRYASHARDPASEEAVDETGNAPDEEGIGGTASAR
jgi:hypothetical protein